VDLTRYFRRDAKCSTSFGAGWCLLQTLQVEPEGTDMTPIGALRVPRRMAVRETLSRAEDIAQLTSDGGTTVAYGFPRGARWTGINIMTNASYTLKGTGGGFFQFDIYGRMIVGQAPSATALLYHYLDDRKVVAIEGVPLRLSFGKTEAIVDDALGQETFSLRSRSQDRETYLPVDGRNRWRELRKLASGDAILRDRLQNALHFDDAGAFIGADTAELDEAPRHRHAITLTFNGDGHVVRVDLGDQGSIGYEYDAAQRLIKVVPATGRRIQYRYDDNGDPVPIRSPGTVRLIQALLGAALILAVAAGATRLRAATR
jgi:YD repeat-containing protein